MRKYYSARQSEKSPATTLKESNLHWLFLEALVQGFGIEGLGTTFHEMISDIVAERSAEKYLAFSSEFTPDSQMYGSSRWQVTRNQYQIVSLLKKYPFSQEEYNIDRTAVALKKVYECEEQCRATNERIRDAVSSGEIPSWVSTARQLIAKLLGELTPELVMKMISNGRHGPGSTASNGGGRVTPYYKYTDFPYTVTSTAAKYALAAISSNPRWMRILEDSGRRKEIPPAGCPQFQKEMMIFWDCVEVVDSDTITFVPKDARTERPIAVGASLNLYLQLGIKSYLEKQLRKVGVDLSDQSKNQRLAKQGSMYSSINGLENPAQFVTIDLASASDTISVSLIELLLPSDWVAILDDLRHKTGLMADGDLISYDKFSAMGNGFTFPLESLVFWAIAKAAALEHGKGYRKSDIAIYGDDIIVRQYVVPHLLPALSWAGFTINARKSFLAGPFKESCGKDYLFGNDVRPFYLKRELTSYADIYFVCNSISRLCMAQRGGVGLHSAFSALISQIPRADRIYLPLGDTSDLGLIVPFESMTGMGLRPFLSSTEKLRLVKRGLLRSEDVHSNSIYSWSPLIVAKTFKGRAAVRCWLSLDKVEVRPEYPRDALVISSGTVTRRNATSYSISIRPVPSWDGQYSQSEVGLHPFIWCRN
nr:MAG: hypothetical protein 3 [Leviviridae sp.]